MKKILYIATVLFLIASMMSACGAREKCPGVYNPSSPSAVEAYA